MLHPSSSAPPTSRAVGGPMNTRTIALIALVIAALLLLFLVILPNA
jgi:hypothetical protein